MPPDRAATSHQTKKPPVPVSPDELLATDVLLLPLLPLDELWDALPPPVAPVTTSLPHDAVAAALARIVTASTLGTVSGLFGFFVSIIG